MYRYLLLAIFIITSSIAHAQAFNTEAVVKQIRARNVFESYTVGFAGKVSRQYLLFEKLVDSANTQYLLRLIKTEPNAVARLYEFKALEAKMHNDKDTAILHNLRMQMMTDTTIVATLNGCIGSKFKVSVLASADYPVYKPRIAHKP